MCCSCYQLYQGYWKNSREMQLFTCKWLPISSSPKALVFLCHGSILYLHSFQSLHYLVLCNVIKLMVLIVYCRLWNGMQ